MDNKEVRLPICSRCYHYKQVEKGRGECHAHAPATNRWPVVKWDDWCGDYKLGLMRDTYDMHRQPDIPPPESQHQPLKWAISEITFESTILTDLSQHISARLYSPLREAKKDYTLHASKTNVPGIWSVPDRHVTDGFDPQGLETDSPNWVDELEPIFLVVDDGRLSINGHRYRLHHDAEGNRWLAFINLKEGDWWKKMIGREVHTSFWIPANAEYSPLSRLPQSPSQVLVLLRDANVTVGRYIRNKWEVLDHYNQYQSQDVIAWAELTDLKMLLTGTLGKDEVIR